MLAEPNQMGYTVTIYRARGMRVVIFLNDHRPAHVHVLGDGEAKIDLLGSDGSPVLIWADRMTRGEIRRAMQIVMQQQQFLLSRWKDIHGGLE